MHREGRQQLCPEPERGHSKAQERERVDDSAEDSTTDCAQRPKRDPDDQTQGRDRPARDTVTRSRRRIAVVTNSVFTTDRPKLPCSVRNSQLQYCW